MTDGTPGLRPTRSPRRRIGRREWLRTLVAVIGGNLLYFSLERFLPPAGRHVPFRFDLGMLVDLWTCLVLYALLGYLRWFRSRPATARHQL